MSGYARPELLASTDWLADNLNRPEVRVVDVRWRPDGTGRTAHATGHVPGAVYLDWATELVDTDDESGLFLLAPPDKLAAALGMDPVELRIVNDLEDATDTKVVVANRCCVCRISFQFV